VIGILPNGDASHEPRRPAGAYASQTSALPYGEHHRWDEPPPVNGSKTAGAAGFALDERRSPSTLAINDQTRRELPQRGNLRRR